MVKKMEHQVTDIIEGKGIDKLGHFYRFFTVHWTMNGTPYTTIVSDDDFKAGLTNQRVTEEAQKITAVYQGVKK